MAIQKREGGGKAEFYKINAKEGCFQQGSGANKVKFDAGNADLTGTIIGMKVEENEYEGQKSEELRIILRDPTPGLPNMHVSFGIATAAHGSSGFALKLLAKLNAIDINQPVTLCPWFAAAGTKMGNFVNDKDMAGVTVHQGGEKVKEDYGDGIAKLPDLPTVKVGSKDVTDKTQWDGLLDGLLEKLQIRLTPAHSDGHAAGEADSGVDPAEAAAAAQQASDAPAANEGRAGMRSRA